MVTVALDTGGLDAARPWIEAAAPEHPSLVDAAHVTAEAFGFVNVPIIKFSVDWWNTLHQPASVLKLGGPAIHSSILVPLIVMGAAYLALFLALHLLAIRTEVMARRVRQMQLAAAGGARAWTSQLRISASSLLPTRSRPR